MFIFFAGLYAPQGYKENEPAAKRRKKGHPVTCPAGAGFPEFMPRRGTARLGRALANSASPQTVQAPHSAKTALLGGVTMGKSGVPFRDFMMPPASLEKILLLDLVWFFPRDLSKRSVVPQMRERDLFAIHTVCEQADDS
ncbi:MAG: hypothetical protein KKD53_09635 [Proteobacteria bacterium]|nr:hypothetical protein [Pseudomonadota bacterium]